MNWMSTSQMWGQQLNKTLTPLIMLSGAFLKKQTNATSHPNLGSLKTALMRNGWKVWNAYYKFRRHENPFEGMFTQ